MCGGDDHLAWKRPIFSEVCRGLRTTDGSLFIVPVLVQCLELTAIDGFMVDFNWSAYHLCGFDSGGIDQFELEDGYSIE
ncbi:hypothetical protein AAG906_013017 [Vitis piasezkii]